MNTSDRKEEEDYEVGDRFSLPLDNEDYDNNENYANNSSMNNNELNNNDLNNNELNNNELNNNELNNNELNNNELNNNVLNNVTAPNMNTSENETTGSEIALLGDDAERYKDDDAFLQDTLMPIMRSYFPTDPSENGEKNILMGVLKHDAIVIVKVKQLMESGTNNNEDFVEIIEEYTDDEYMDKETIEDTLELTLKYVTGLKSSIDSYVEYEFFCSSIPGYKQFVEEMLQYRVVMRLNRHMFYKELYGYLRKEVFDNYDFNTAIFDFDSEVNEFVKENKRQGRNNNKKPTANKKPTVNNYEEVPTGIINANKINTSRVGSSIFGTANSAKATAGTANSTVNTANATVGTANSTVNTANATEKSTATPSLMNQITAAITATPATTATPVTTPATPPPTLLNQIATATGLRAPQKGGRITPRQGHSSSRFTRRH